MVTPGEADYRGERDNPRLSKNNEIDKTVCSTDELQAYAVYQPDIDIYKETKDRATIKYNKELETLELEFNKVVKEKLIKS